MESKPTVLYLHLSRFLLVKLTRGRFFCVMLKHSQVGAEMSNVDVCFDGGKEVEHFDIY